MSKLLSKKDWLILPEAVRYYSALAKDEVAQADLLSAYIDLGIFARFDSQLLFPLYTFELINPETSYPAEFYVSHKEYMESDILLHSDGELHLHDTTSTLKPQQRTYSNQPVLSSRDLEPKYDSGYAPLYQGTNHITDHGMIKLVELTWGHVIKTAPEAIQLQRFVVEHLIEETYGKKENSTTDNHKHTSRLLGIQAEAIEKFWARYDPTSPDTAPDGDAIIAWLVGRGCSKSEANAIDTIIRHDSRKKGGRKPS